MISKNNLIDSNTGYGQTMAVLEDAAGSTTNATSMLYLRKYSTGTCTVVGCRITAQGIAAPVTLTSFTSNDVNGIGEMTISPAGTQLMIGNNLGSQIMLGVYTTGGELKSFTMNSTHDGLTAGSSQSLGSYTAARSVAYTASGNNVYANIIKVYQGTVKRYTSTFSSSTAISTNATGDIRRGNDDNIYVAWVQGTNLAKITTPDGGSPSVVNTPINSSGTLTGGMPTQRHRIDYGLTCPTPLYTRTLGKKQYELNDHLGNVRVVISDWKQSVLTSGVPGSFTAETRSYYNYYAFGMEEVGRNYNGVNYRYGFNGKEGDTEWDGGGNTYDYGFRIYNPRLGKFLSVDPLTKGYPMLTPYQFASDNPIPNIDLDGLESKSTVIPVIGGPVLTNNLMQYGLNTAHSMYQLGAGLLNIGSTIGSGFANATCNYIPQTFGFRKDAKDFQVWTTQYGWVDWDGKDHNTSINESGKTVGTTVVVSATIEAGLAGAQFIPKSWGTSATTSSESSALTPKTVTGETASVGSNSTKVLFDGESNTFIENLSFNGRVTVQDNTLTIEIGEIQKIDLTAAKNSGYKSIINKAESLAKEHGVNEIRIEGIVVNDEAAIKASSFFKASGYEVNSELFHGYTNLVRTKKLK